MKFFLSIAGNIGVGKTTLAHLCADYFRCSVYLEKFIENPYLSDFYENMERWSFHSQLFFLAQNFKAHLEIDQFQGMCIKDRTIYEDSEVFATNLFKQGLMNQRDFACYQDIYQTMISALKYPDLIIYLKASPSVLIRRIQKRERTFEQKINEKYLQQINLTYHEWIKKVSDKTNILTVDTDHFNIFKDHDKLEQIYESIEKVMKRLNAGSQIE